MISVSLLRRERNIHRHVPENVPVQPLLNHVAVVAGATRGAGRGIARMLGAAGATVYCTGRSVRGRPAAPGRPETIEETAELVTGGGGRGIAVRTDHTVESEVERLFARVRDEQGRLDVLVNDVWGGDALTEWGSPFWELSVAKGAEMLERAVHSHVITSRHGAPLMVKRNARAGVWRRSTVSPTSTDDDPTGTASSGARCRKSSNGTRRRTRWTSSRSAPGSTRRRSTRPQSTKPHGCAPGSIDSGGFDLYPDCPADHWSASGRRPLPPARRPGSLPWRSSLRGRRTRTARLRPPTS